MNERELKAQLTESELEQLASGFHEDVASALRARERPDLAGVVLEQIWAWDGALAAYREADLKLDALSATAQNKTTHIPML